MKRSSIILLFYFGLFFSLFAENKEVITQWTFDGSLLPVVGTGTASLIGGTLEHSIDPSKGWRFYNFPEQGLASGTAGAAFMMSTEGYKNITFEFEQRSSGTASRWAEFQYTVDGGTNWISYGNNYGGLNPRDEFYPFSMDLTDISEVNNNPNFGVRVVSIFSPLAFNPGVPDKDYEANVAYHRSRDWDDEGEEYSPAGNWRLREVVLYGDVILLENPSKLSFISLNEGESVYAGVPFEVSIGAFNDEDEPTVVSVDTQVTIELSNGNGALTGTLSGSLKAGSHLVTISGILYDKSETGVRLTAMAEGLAKGISEDFEVFTPQWTLNLNCNIPGAGLLSGDGDYFEGDEVSVEASAGEGFIFTGWQNVENEILTTNTKYSLVMPGQHLDLIANFEIVRGETVIHYWHFNDLPESGELTEINADYSVNDAMITYPGTGIGYMDSYHQGSEFNVVDNAEAGQALRVRNPAVNRQMIIKASSRGYENLFLSFEVYRSNNGATRQNLYFSIDDGVVWHPVKLGYEINTEYNVYSFPLAAWPEINNKQNLQFRILFSGENYTGDSGNNRFDNILLTGDPFDESVSINNPELDELEFVVYPNPASDKIMVKIDELPCSVQILSSTGQMLMEKQAIENEAEFDISNFPAGLYIVKVNYFEKKVIKTAAFIVK